MGDFCFMEQWKEITHGYSVSNYGRIKNKHNNILAIQQRPNGYYQIGLFIDGKQRFYKIHRLVAEYFLEPPTPEQLEWAATTKHNKVFVNHKDGDKSNNHYDNLEWVTHQENITHAVDNGLRYTSPPSAKLSIEQVEDIRMIYSTNQIPFTKLAEQYNVSRHTISNIINNKTWRK